VRALIAAAALPALLAGCVTLSVGGGSAPPAAAPAPSLDAPLPPPVARPVWPDPVEDETNNRARGFGLVHSAPALDYLNGLYARLKAAAGVPEWPGRVYLIASDGLDAHASAAGNVYLALPWLKQADSEDELAALIAHEFGHVYLHYHRLDSVVVDADYSMSLLQAGMALARREAASRRWGQADSVQAAYALGMNFAANLYGRGEEYAADEFALKLLHRLGYSYDGGVKAMLERIDSREAALAERLRQRREALLGQRSEAIRAKGRQDQTKGELLAPVTAEISVGITSLISSLSDSISDSVSEVAGDHPRTADRLERVALVAERHEAELALRRPADEPLQRLRAREEVRRLLENYQLAFDLIADPAAADGPAKAQRAVSGPTARHAVPLFAAYMVQQSRPASGRGQARDPAQLLELNMASESDRAWIVFRERADAYLRSHDRRRARGVVELGLQHFARAEEAWPDVVQRYGIVEDWNTAKQWGRDCAARFERMRSRCEMAALSPDEMRERERQAQQKGEDLANRLKRRVERN